jgi:hypothetical protein
MSQSVRLSAIMEVIEISSEEFSSYLNRITGHVITLPEEEISAAEEGDDLDDYPEWQRESILMASDFLKNKKDYLGLPTKDDLDEYRLMEKFSLSLEDPKTSEILYCAIKGRGAFRRFKDALHRLNLTAEWYAYREAPVRQVAIDWCELNEINWQD